MAVRVAVSALSKCATSCEACAGSCRIDPPVQREAEPAVLDAAAPAPDSTPLPPLPPPLLQGYGLTETAASSVIAMSDDWAYHATVGVPTPGTELRFESVPDMNYDALSPEGPRGEILLRGPPTFTGYYKNDKGEGLAGMCEAWRCAP